MVLMFSHYINHMENTGALEGHRMLMANEFLTVVVTLGRFHHWQRWVELEAQDKPDWMKVLTVSAGDFRHRLCVPILNHFAEFSLLSQFGLGTCIEVR